MNVSVTKEDLIGQIANFPLKIVEAMVANQVRQGNPANVKVFQEKVDASFVEGGFSWNKSAEGQFFWSKVINGKQFPKEIVPPDKSIEPVKPEEPVNESPEEVVEEAKEASAYKVGDVIRVKAGSNTRSRVIIGYFPEMPNPYLTIIEESFKDFMKGKTSCHINVTAIEEPKKYVYLTLKDISEGKGVGIDPDLIKIVQ
jgi:hypothetical protein